METSVTSVNDDRIHVVFNHFCRLGSLIIKWAILKGCKTWTNDWHLFPKLPPPPSFSVIKTRWCYILNCLQSHKSYCWKTSVTLIIFVDGLYSLCRLANLFMLDLYLNIIMIKTFFIRKLFLYKHLIWQSNFVEILSAFDAIDVNKDGSISKKEMREAARIAGMNPTDQEVEEWWNAADANGS